jgi:hypothetical protein
VGLRIGPSVKFGGDKEEQNSLPSSSAAAAAAAASSQSQHQTYLGRRGSLQGRGNDNKDQNHNHHHHPPHNNNHKSNSSKREGQLLAIKARAFEQEIEALGRGRWKKMHKDADNVFGMSKGKKKEKKRCFESLNTIDSQSKYYCY